MKIEKLSIAGAYKIILEPHYDNRGYFTRSYCENEFSEAGLVPYCAQTNISHSINKYTLRGLHYQDFPSAEDKYVRCIKGYLYDIILDLRPDSKTYTQWIGIWLKGLDKLSDPGVSGLDGVYIPKGCAHGFLSLEPDTTIMYQVSQSYNKEAERGVGFNDPKFNITWPCNFDEITISDKDANWPLWKWE